MNKTMSIYLDLMRFLAAFIVFIAHANHDRFTGGLPVLWRFSNLGSDAVIAFFVLSGFVIAHVANGKEKTPDDFFISRFARLYSVVLPALILTIILDAIGSQFAHHELFESWGYTAEDPVARTLANLFFVNQLWFLDVRAFSNLPFWSIGYEFWYYVLFAVSFYFQGLSRNLWLILISALVGPKILLLLPVWWMGVLVYKITSEKLVSEWFGWFAFSTSLVLFCLYKASGGGEYISEYTQKFLGVELFNSLTWSRDFLSFYVVGFLVSLSFVGFEAVSHRFAIVLAFLSEPIRYLASYTFALYLFHYPLLQFFAALTYEESVQKTEPMLVVFGTIVSIWLLGGVSEKQKRRYRKVITSLFERVRARRAGTDSASN